VSSKPVQLIVFLCNVSIYTSVLALFTQSYKTMSIKIYNNVEGWISAKLVNPPNSPMSQSVKILNCKFMHASHS